MTYAFLKSSKVGFSFDVTARTDSGGMSAKLCNILRHWSTDSRELHKISVDFLIALIKQIPTNVFPAPQGKIIKPERANDFLSGFSPNILDKAFSC